jgi:release factor glutamine methyltransferase
MLLKNYQKKLLEQRVDGCLRKECEDRVRDGEPFEYVINYCEFLGLDLYVDQNVLIPRVESEILAEMVIERVFKAAPEMKVLDLCCGSGALGLSVQKHTGLDVTLVDICSKALHIARGNAKSNNIVSSFIQSDLFSGLLGQKFDIIVCNPPYISKKEYDALDKSVRGFEPQKALVGGDSGLEFYQSIAQEIAQFVNPGANLFFEIGFDQGRAMFEIFSNPIFTKKELLKDYSGHDRFFFLEVHTDRG